MTTRAAAVLASLALSGCSFDAAVTEARQGDACRPVETRSPNASGQRPDFAGQTRACSAPSNVAFDVTVVARGLDHPWGIEPLPGGGFVVTERAGRMRAFTAEGLQGPPIAGLPRVDARGQGGLLDVALSPSFASDRTLFWSYSEPREGGNATSVARGRLSEDGVGLDDVRVVVRAQPTYDGTMHFGSRLAFGPDGLLYVTLGERSDGGMRPQAQRLDSHMGKVLRVDPDGTPAADNPFAGRADALPEVWTLGHRNIQAAAFDGEGRLWIIEHGTRGGDELNLIVPGTNYGWPIVAFGEEYSGMPIANATTSRPGYQGPVYYWDPVIAPSGAQFYGGDAFPAWKGSLFVGSLGQQRLVRLVLDGDRVIGEEHLLADRDARIRDVREAHDGSLYVTTDASNGEVWRITPRR